MGRDKTPKPAAAVEVKTEVIIGLDGRPQRPPRGESCYQADGQLLFSVSFNISRCVVSCSQEGNLIPQKHADVDEFFANCLFAH